MQPSSWVADMLEPCVDLSVMLELWGEPSFHDVNPWNQQSLSKDISILCGIIPSWSHFYFIQLGLALVHPRTS
jgi:hypothetical protein